ncbi:hypothetical protein [Tomitella gaofuii]|uniref:hypothetical protein n=2 Tax=Tomitella gaofuii TaxID=2760083 RepID=UPI0015FE221B|nr:hypothetical protein [Tomitella gaofuii]
MTAVTSADREVDDQRDGSTGSEPAGEGAAGASMTLRATAAVLIGVIGLLVGFAHLDRVQMWALEYGRAWVYLGFFLYASVFGRVFWWGVDTLIAEFRTARPHTAGGPSDE